MDFNLIRLPSKLKQLLLTSQLWWNYYQKHTASLRDVVLDNINRILACGRLFMGYATWLCSNEQCSHSKKICMGCKSRFCNTCGKKLTDQWIEKQRALLPDTEWQHITFTMPGELWAFFLLNRELLKPLSAIAAKAIQTVARKKSITPGIFTALHTFGRDLKWNVHIHLSVTRGGITDDHKHWKALFFSREAIMPQWRYGIINLLREAYKSGTLTLPDTLRANCHNLTDFNRFLDVHYQKSWIVHFAQATKTPKATISYLGRYLKRPPLAMSRLKHYDGNTVMFEYLDHKSKRYLSFTCEGEEFLDRLTQHIPEKGFQMIRYYGFLANRVRSTLLPKVYTLLNQPERNALKITYAGLLKSTFGLDPHQCILCQSAMVFAGITRGRPQRELHKYTKALALAKPIR